MLIKIVWLLKRVEVFWALRKYRQITALFKRKGGQWPWERGWGNELWTVSSKDDIEHGKWMKHKKSMQADP